MIEHARTFFSFDPFAKWFVGFFFFLTFVFLAHFWVVGQAIYGDGIYYYAFTKSIVKDHDIHLVNEYEHLYSPKENNSLMLAPPAVVENVTANGFAQNKYGIGAPLFWIIPFVLADGLVGWWNIISLPVSSEGFGDVYQVFVGIFNVMAAMLGSILLYSFLKQHFKPQVALLTVAVFLFGTNLFYYSSVDVLNSHPFSFLFSTIFLIYWWRTLFNRTLTQWFILGIIVGVLLLIRTQDIAFLVLLLAEAVVLFWKKGSSFTLMRGEFGKYGLFGIGLLLAFAPQLLTWQIIYGDIWTSPYFRSGEGFNFLQPKLIELFTYPKIGIIYWTPVFIVSIVSLVFFLKKQKRLAGFCLLVILSEIYLISSWSGWTQGESFGVRMLITSIPFMAVGLAYALQVLVKNLNTKYVYAMILGVIAINFVLILYFLLIYQGPTNDREIVTQERSLQKIQNLFIFDLP